MDSKTRTAQEIFDEIGASPSEILNDLEAFRRNAQVLSSEGPRLIDEYPQQWVALFDGRVCAHADTLEDLMSALERKQLAKEKVIVRFIDHNETTMIL